jgi:hypothetical protein
MKNKKKIYYVILVFATLIGLWLIPAFVKKAAFSPDNYPFVYYSSVLKELGIIDYKDKKVPLSDLEGHKYTVEQFDSLMPLLNYRQLMADGRLPDSIGGYAVTPPLLRSKSVVFRYHPTDAQSPETGLYVMFESMPKRVGLEMPEDVFRMKSRIEFIDMATNTVNQAKSNLFQLALEKEGFQFPAKGVWGNPNPRKPYDEGYFCLDNAGKLFHLKMVNGRPFVRDTHAGDSLRIAHFSMYEAGDKRFYGFLFSEEGDSYIIENNEGKYTLSKLDVPSLALDKGQLYVMGNLLYWTVSITTPAGRTYYGLEAESLKRIAEYKVDRTENNWDKAAKWLFPYYLSFEDENDNFVLPHIQWTGIAGFALHIVLAFVAGIFLYRSRGKRIFGFVYTLLTGIAGFVALLLLPRSND